MKEIKYTSKGFTQSNNEYVTIDDEDMAALMSQSITTLATFAELTATSEGSRTLMNRNKELYGKRGKTDIAPGRENTIMSVIGGLVRNYQRKDAIFKNDISLNQLPYIAQALNEYGQELGYQPIVFRNKLFDFGK
jgi:hypothetical protein